MKNKNCAKNQNEMWQCICEKKDILSSFPTLHLHMGSTFLKHWFELRAENYIYYS